MMTQCFYLNFSYIYCLLWHIYVLLDIFRLQFSFQPSATYRYQLLILNLLQSFLNRLAMLIRVQTKNEQDRVHIVEYICFNRFLIHQEAIMNHFELTNPDNHEAFLVLIAQISRVAQSLLVVLLNLIRCKKRFYLVMIFH